MALEIVPDGEKEMPATQKLSRQLNDLQSLERETRHERPTPTVARF
jgi:hypothetical protein